MALFHETADVSVRPAVSGDETSITRLQIEAWRATHAAVLGPQVLDALNVERMNASWSAAIESPPGPGFGVLVACAGSTVVGFAALAPGQLLSLEVGPAHRRGGHGSRLLSASVDRLRRDGADEVATWVVDGDSGREQFLAGAGLCADNRERTLATGVRDVVERRWSASIAQD